MAIQITPDQVPQFWEAIKYASVSADYVEEPYREKYLTKLLYRLLSGKAQCFVRIGKDRKLEAIAITEIKIDEIRDENSLFIGLAYSFKKVEKEFWIQDIESLRQFAKRENCKIITAWASNEVSEGLAEKIGLKNRLKSYVMEV